MPTNFLQAAGTSGYIASILTLLSTELNALANGSSVVSSVGGSSGVFGQTNTSNAIWGSVAFEAGGAFTPTAGGALYGWFTRSLDGTHFEKTVTASTTVPPVARAPDFVIPLDASAYAASDFSWSQDDDRTALPAGPYKVVLWNLAGATLPSTGNTIQVGGTAIQY